MASKKKSWFTRFAKATAAQAGRPRTFAIATLSVVVWAASGPMFHFSDTWQLVINTSTTIITFLMVFLIQNTQNRDSEALQIKLDELVRAIDGANNVMLNLEELEEEDLDKIRKRYLELAEEARKAGQHKGGSRKKPSAPLAMPVLFNLSGVRSTSHRHS